MSKKYVYFDSETHSGGREYDMPPEEFVRLFQYAINDGPVQMFSDLEQARQILREADYIVGHNIISSDLTWIFGMDSIEPLYMAMERKVIDTFYLANLLKPAPYSYTRENGSVSTAASKPVEHAMGWLSLANLCFQFGLEGKLGNLKELAKPYQPKGTKVADYEYGLIPLDDPDFLAYAEQDVIAVRNLFHYLMSEIRTQDYPGEYIWREMEIISATVGQMHRNGIKVNAEYANKRVAEMSARREEVMAWLVEKYDFPTEGKSPWASAKGKEAIISALADYGITPKTLDWPRTPTGALKLGGEDLKLLAEGTDAEEFVDAIAELKGMRSIPQLVLDNMKADGRVHPKISSLQRSGRWSFTDPGVTIFGERNEKLKADKALFIADEGKVLAGFDYSSADARAMAALSGDEEFAKRFEEDDEGNALYDGHNLTGEAIFGPDDYYGDGPRDKSAKPALRPVSKAAGHAQNYNIGAYKLATTLNTESKKQKLGMHFWAPANTKYGQKEIEKFDDSMDTRDFISNFNETYVWLKRFKDQAVQEAEAYGYVTNSWGRRMAVDSGRAFTMGPALHGQSVTREMMGDAILRLIRKGEYYIRSMRAIIHDELLLEFDEATIEEDIAVVKECMEHTFDPQTNVSIAIKFPVGHGYGKTWRDASH
ncbi:DNA polymerase I [Microbacterium phage WaterT]|nr:DNA polymerase I [Microbacterium phage WaterT]